MTNSCTTSEAQSADSQYSPDFMNLVEIKSRDGLTSMWVHQDVISRSSLFMKTQLEKGTIVLMGEIKLPGLDCYRLAKLSELKDYIHWLYTGAVANSFGNSCADLALQWKIGVWLRDLDYANAVMDKLIMREYDDAVTIFSGFEDHLEEALQGSKLWHWAVDSIGAVASTANIGRLRAPLITTEIHSGEDFLMDVFMKMLSRIEDPENHQIPVIADREKYHLTMETFEDTRAVWMNR